MTDLLSRYAGKRVVVTGGAGYIGTCLVHRLCNVPCQIVLVDRRASDVAGTVREGPAQIENVRADICDRSEWAPLLKGADFVFHFAGQTSVYVANEHPTIDFEANVRPMLHLLETCRQNDCRPGILFASTVTVAGLTECLPVDESHAEDPITVYDVHKLAAEKYLRYYVQAGLASGAVLRLANVYGPGPSSSSADRGILNRMVGRALRGEALTVYGAGHWVRDYVYIDDVVDAFLAAGANLESVAGQHYVIGTGKGHTIAEAAQLVQELAARRTGRVAPLEYVDVPEGLSPIEYRNFVADPSHFHASTGWRAKVTLASGIEKCLTHQQERADQGKKA